MINRVLKTALLEFGDTFCKEKGIRLTKTRPRPKLGQHVLVHLLLFTILTNPKPI